MCSLIEGVGGKVQIVVMVVIMRAVITKISAKYRNI